MLSIAAAIHGFAVPSTDRTEVVRTSVVLPAHIKHLGSLDASKAHTLPVIFQVAPKNVEALHEAALAVSAPSDPRYGQHLSAADVAELTAPSAADVKAVAEWLKPAAESIAVDELQGLVHASLSTAKAAALLDTDFIRLECSVSNHRFVRAG